MIFKHSGCCSNLCIASVTLTCCVEYLAENCSAMAARSAAEIPSKDFATAVNWTLALAIS